MTAAIALVTTLSSLWVIWSGSLDRAAFDAGFIPVRAGGTPSYLLDAGMWPFGVTPVSATLVHGGITHLLLNLVMLLFAGRSVERVLGRLPVILLYLLGAYAAALAHWAVQPTSLVPMIGASGAISALLGAYSVLYARKIPQAVGPIPGRVVQAASLIAAWSAINLALELVTRASELPIAGVAHIGGFVVGVLLARPLLAMRWKNA